jgi:hypothetical protein
VPFATRHVVVRSAPALSAIDSAMREREREREREGERERGRERERESASVIDVARLPWDGRARRGERRRVRGGAAAARRRPASLAPIAPADDAIASHAH